MNEDMTSSVPTNATPGVVGTGDNPATWVKKPRPLRQIVKRKPPVNENVAKTAAKIVGGAVMDTIKGEIYKSLGTFGGHLKSRIEKNKREKRGKQ
jgi:hypothetical protein